VSVLDCVLTAAYFAVLFRDQSGAGKGRALSLTIKPEIYKDARVFIQLNRLWLLIARVFAPFMNL